MEKLVRENIKEIAYRLFKERGYKHVTIKDICQAANIAKTTFYYYFSSKEALIEDCIKQPEPVAIDILNDILLMDTYWEQIWYLTYYVTVKTQQIGPSVFNQVIKSNLDENKGTFDFLNNKLMSITLPIVEKAQRNGEIHNMTNAKSLIQATWTTHIGLYTQWCIKNGSFDLAKQELEQLEIILQVDDKYRFTLEEFNAKYNI